MTEQNENLILEILKKIQNEQFHSRLVLNSLVNRVGNVEMELANMHGDLANIHGILAGHSVRMDRFDNRFERIERRLDIVS